MKSSCSQKLDDFEILKKIVNKELNMQDVDMDTKIRLIKLCDNRINDITQKIETIDKKIKKISPNCN